MSDRLENGDFPKDGAYEVVNKFIDINKVKESGKFVMLPVRNYQIVRLNILKLMIMMKR